MMGAQPGQEIASDWGARSRRKWALTLIDWVEWAHMKLEWFMFSPALLE
jgi:hypothetical protein